MSVIDSQPSPFGHLTRERHIESISKLPGKKQKFSELLVEEMSPDQLTLRAGSDSTGVPRSPPLKATRSRFASACSSSGHSCHVDAWIRSEAVSPGRRCQGSLAWPPAGSGCEDGLRPTQQQAAGVFSNLEGRGYVVSAAGDGRGPLVATEEYSKWCFHLCGPARSCHLYLQDREGHVVLWFCRPFRMGLGCLCCCPMEIRAFTSDNQLVGIVRQRCRIFSHLLEVCDARGSAIMKISGSGVTCRCFSKQEFQVLSSTGHMVASIWKRWPGFQEERNMDHEFFGVDMVAADLSNEERICLLAATFLLNFMFFEVS